MQLGNKSPKRLDFDTSAARSGYEDEPKTVEWPKQQPLCFFFRRKSTAAVAVATATTAAAAAAAAVMLQLGYFAGPPEL